MSEYYTATNARTTCLSVMICLALFFLTESAHGSANNASCLMCHSARTLSKSLDGKEASLFVSPLELKSSAHAGNACIDCHADLKGQPAMHKTDVAPVQCAGCHEKAHKDTIHAGTAKDPKSPKCQDCHGSHDIKPIGNSASAVHPANSEATCGRCHTDAKTLSPYKQSMHGMSTDRSAIPGAGCTDCHQAHKDTKPGTPSVCGKCHEDAHAAFNKSSHGKAVLGGDSNAPDCATCHGGHDIGAVKGEGSPVHPLKISALCSRCHDDPQMMKPYDLPHDRLKTYMHSFHGIALGYGDTSMATCVSCHKAHDILPSDDPASSTHSSNLPGTCGECHSNTNPKWAQGAMHVTISPENKDVLYYVSNAFKWLTIGTMTALIGHIMLDLFAQFKIWRRRYPGGAGR